MKVEDYFVQGRRGHVQLHEKGGKFLRLVCHHNLEKYLDEYIAGGESGKTPTSPLFQSVTSRTGKELSGKPMKQSDVYVMISGSMKCVAGDLLALLVFMALMALRDLMGLRPCFAKLVEGQQLEMLLKIGPYLSARYFSVSVGRLGRVDPVVLLSFGHVSRDMKCCDNRRFRIKPASRGQTGRCA